MDAHWIVTANAGRARVFSQDEHGAPFTEIDDLINESVRLRTVDTETDDLAQRGGSTRLSGSATPSQPSGYEPHQTPAEHQVELFARRLAAFLLRGHQEHRYRALSLAASPEFLGVLRKLLDPAVANAIDLELPKDYTHSNAAQLRDQFQKHRVKS